jgi:hypothetical protein
LARHASDAISDEIREAIAFRFIINSQTQSNCSIQ